MSSDDDNPDAGVVEAAINLDQQQQTLEEAEAASSVPTGIDGKGSNSDVVVVSNKKAAINNVYSPTTAAAKTITAAARKNERRRIALFVFACLYTFFFIGAFFGWGPMQLLLEANGTFSWKCDGVISEEESIISSNSTSTTMTDGDDDNENEVCPAQTTALNNIHFIATVTQVSSPILGAMTDKFGAQKMAFLMLIFLWIGLGLLAISVSLPGNEKVLDQLLYVAYIFLAHGTWIGALITVQTGMYFQNERTRNRVIFILNSIFDSGAVTYLGLWSIGQAIHKDIVFLSWAYLGLSVIVLGPAFYFWAVAIPAHKEASNITTANKSPPSLAEEEEEDSCGGKQENDASKLKKINSGFASDTFNTMDPSASELGVLDSNCARFATNRQSEVTVTLNDEPIPSTPQSDVQVKKTALKQQSNVTNKTTETTSTRNPNSPDSGEERSRDHNRYILVADRTPLKQITSVPHLMISIFFALHASSNQFTLTTTRDYLAALGDDEIGNKYLTIFTLLTPASLLAIPLVDVVMIRCGLHGGFQTINALALSYLLIRILHDQLDGIQILGFLIFSCYRCFLFGITMSSLPTLLAPHVVGKATGLNLFLTGVVSAVNIPLANFTIKRWNGDFRIPNLIYSGMLLSCIGVSWVLERYMRLERREKQRQRDTKPGVTG